VIKNVTKHNPEDNLGFPAGLMFVAFGYAIFFAVYNWGYGNGHDANKCKQAHGYRFEKTKAAFIAGVKE
jgi:hypothetical protein